MLLRSLVSRRPTLLADSLTVSSNQALQPIFGWFRDAGGSVGEEDQTPVELRLGSALFYAGVIEESTPIVELSALLYLGAESTSTDEEKIVDIAERVAERAPDDISVETTESVGTDVWAAIMLDRGDLEHETLGSQLRSFVDYSLRTIDEIQQELHPLEVVRPTPLQDSLTKLHELVGVEDLVKKAEELVALAEVAKLRKEQGLKATVLPPHLVFTGNPGTGKTTVARLMGAIYKQIGLLETGHLIEARRSDLIGEYTGQTTPKTEKVINSALGGVLFIDEAYSLMEDHGRKRSYGQECIETLLLAMENKRGQFALIVAGYPEEMKQFVESNPGLRSRFDQFWHFRDYTNEELVTIVERYVAKNEYSLADGCRERLLSAFSSVARDKFFGNARLAREVFHSMKRLHAVRAKEQNLRTREALMTFLPEDIQIERQKQAKRQIGFR